MLVLKIFLKEAGALDTERNIIRVFNRQKDLCSYKIVLRLFKKTNQKKTRLKKLRFTGFSKIHGDVTSKT